MKTTAKPIVILTAVALPVLALTFLYEGAAFGQSPDPQRRSDPSPPSAAPSVPRSAPKDAETHVPVTFTGGYETDRRDGGRPVVLIAAALGVPSTVFRQAFNNVTPAAGGREPEPGQVRRNKEALLRTLGPYGITNERLDTVSNYYRYNRSRGEMWRNTPATAYATVRNRVVTGFTITNPGSGYSSLPQVSLSGVANLKATATVSYSTDLNKNGTITALALGGPDSPSAGSGGSSGQDGRGGPGGFGVTGGPGASGRPSGRMRIPAGFVPGDMLGPYLGLDKEQKQKLDRLVKTVEALRNENFALPAFAQLKLTDDQIRKIAEGESVKDVLTPEQNRILDANRRPESGGLGAPRPRG